jgi:hypothetical protein
MGETLALAADEPVGLRRTDPSVRGGRGLRTRSTVLARCQVTARCCHPALRRRRARNTASQSSPTRWIAQRARRSLVGPASHDALGCRADVDLLQRDAWPPSLSSPSDSSDLSSGSSCRLLSRSAASQQIIELALEIGELARPSARPTGQLSPVSHGALIVPGAGEASRRAREAWPAPRGAADLAAHRVAPRGAPSELFPNILATTRGGRAAAEGGEAPAIAGYLHGWHNGGDRRGLPSKPWVAGSNPAGGVAGPGTARNVSHRRPSGHLSLRWRGPGPLLDSGVHGGRSSAGRAPGCGPGGRGFESHRSPLVKGPG